MLRISPAFLMAMVAVGMSGQAVGDWARIDRAVVSKVSTQFGIRSQVIRRLDLTEPFQTRSRWSLVVVKQPDAESRMGDGAGNPMGAIFLCFVRGEKPDCSDQMFVAKHGEEVKRTGASTNPVYQLFASDVVYSEPGRTRPLLRIRSCGTSGANGNCGVSTFLFAYDSEAETFSVAFFREVGRNNNQEVRFIEDGPLLGAVAVVNPTRNAPFTYFVEVYRRGPGGGYSRVLRYRGTTGYGDENRLAVIDSEMPEMLRRLGLWKVGDPVPVPKRLPSGCSQVVLRKGLAWCGGR